VPHLISPTWSAFRTHFAQRGNALGRSVSFTASPNEITQLTGSFVDDGFLATQEADVIGSSNNDGQKAFTVVSVAALTMVVSETPTAEGPVVVDMHGGWYDTEGTPEWPGVFAAEAGRTNLMRASSFTGSMTGMPQPYLNASPGYIELTLSGFTSDSVAFTPEYRWYLSQGTDVTAKQYWTLTGKPNLVGTSYSGIIRLTQTALATAEFTATPTIEDAPGLLRNAHVYVQRVSDGAIQWLDLYKESRGGNS